VIVVEVNKNLLILCETAGDEWICKCLIRNCKVIEPKHFIDLEFRKLDLMRISLFFAKYPHPELAIINVDTCKLSPRPILLDPLDLDVFSLDLLFKTSLVVIKTIHYDFRKGVIHSLHGDCKGRVIRNYQRNDRVRGYDTDLFHQVREVVLVSYKSWIWLDSVYFALSISVLDHTCV
jgi:hypothetical protein